MDHTVFRYDEPFGRPRGRVNFFGWTIAILLLTGFALAAWLGSYYIFNQPERPDSYRILQRLHKIEQPKRFQLTAAPPGEFLDPKKLHERYSNMRPTELAKANADLARNYIRNYQGVAGHVPYVVGQFTIMAARQLGPKDLFTSGMVALTDAIDYGELLMEHVYPADAQAVPLMKETLATGLEIKLERSHDLSVVVHAERLPDGRLLLTTVPLLYGSYTVTQGRGTFSLEPPYQLNMAAGWPLFKNELRREAEVRYASYREKSGPRGRGVPIPGLASPTASVAPANELVRVESAVPVELPKIAAATPTISVAASQARETTVVAKNDKPAGSPAPAPGRPRPAATIAANALPALAAASPTAAKPPAIPSGSVPTAVAAVSPGAATAPGAAPTAAPVAPGVALASTAGGGTWKTYPAGKMPIGRLVTPSDLSDVADRGLARERVYLKGQFVVNFAESNRAVLRPKSNTAQAMLRLGAPSSTRIIVEFPAGYAPPAQGSVVSRDEARPYEITEVRKQSDGQLNVFVREIMQ
ncbi:MAG: hypothetical protein H0X73_02850 [Chthoniobacterales bacterium]|nr:hypothetical protein [Chthoniobacterales bacterium]